MAVSLAGLTPVALSFGAAPAIDWGDLGGTRFSDPFFDQTVERWAGGVPPPRLVRTDIAALDAFEDRPELDPSLLIFHMSRCGSTLVSRLLATAEPSVVIAEPKPINTLLMAGPEALGAGQPMRLLRLLVRALGRSHDGERRPYVLKLSSWNVTRFALFRRAFPAARLLWLQRAPVEVMASLLADPPGWMQLRHVPPQAAALFGIPAADAARLDAETFCARALAAMLVGACAADDGGATLLDYGELPDAIWHRVAPLAGLALDPVRIARMQEEARFHAKDPTRRPFGGDAARNRAVPDHARKLAAELVEPLYRALDRRRIALSNPAAAITDGA